MVAGYCFVCDREAATDPCPACGRPLPVPEDVAITDPDREVRRLLNPDDQPVPVGRRLPIWVAAVGIAVGLIVILVLLRSSFGI